MINLNDDSFKNKETVTEETLFQLISDYDVFNHYIDDFVLNLAISSPLRKDSNPSFSVFYAKKKDRLLYRDHGNADSGSCIKFIMLLFNIGYNEALIKVALDFGLESKFKIPNGLKRTNDRVVKVFDRNHIDKLIRVSNVIQVSSRNWNQQDLNYWEQYGVSYITLIKYNITPIRYLFINNEVYGVDKLAYAYSEMKDGEIRYKIYQPFSNRMKWVNNLIEGTLSGWSQLDETGDLLVIASSLKDGMFLHDLGFTNFIAPQTENYIFKTHIVDALRSRFKEIVVFYDHDNAGLNASEKMREIYGFKYFTTNNSKYKDPSDYYKFNKDEVQNMLSPINKIL